MQEEVQSEISIKEIILKIKDEFRYLKAKWILILLFGLMGGIIGYIYASNQEKIYTATLSFVLEDEKSGSSGGAISGLAGQFGFDVGGGAGGAFSGANLMELMKSRTLVEKTLLSPVNVNRKEISLAEFYMQYNEMRKDWEKNPEFKNVQFLPNADRSKFTLWQNKVLSSIYSQIISKMLSVSQKDKKVAILYIEVSSQSELFAKYFAESLSRVVSDFYIDTKSKKSKTNVAILQNQADSLRAELNAAMLGVASANDNTFNLNPALNIKRVTSARKQIDVQANSAMLTQIVQNLEVAKVSLRKETPLIQAIDMPILPLPFEQASTFKLVITGGFWAGMFIVFFLMMRKGWRRMTN